MSKVRQASAVLLSAALAVPLVGVGPASAAPVKEPAAADGYFSSTGLPDTGTNAGKPPNVTAEADGVAPGNLAVAGGEGAEQKVSFLFFSLDALEPGGSITKAELTVPLVPGDNRENLVVGADPAKVRACLAGPEGFGGEHGESITVAPARLCEDAEAPAKLSADGKAYVFDVTPIAAIWATANDGLALTTAEGAGSTPFQVVFAPGAESTLAYETTAPPDLGLPPLPPTTGTDFGAVGSGSSDFGGFDGGSLPAVDSGSFGTVDAPVVSAEVPLPAPQAAPAAPQVALTPAASGVALTESMRPTAAFWIGALLLAAALALLSLIMGDPRVPQASTRQSKLTQSLQARERAGGRSSGFSARPATA